MVVILSKGFLLIVQEDNLSTALQFNIRLFTVQNGMRTCMRIVYKYLYRLYSIRSAEVLDFLQTPMVRRAISANRITLQVPIVCHTSLSSTDIEPLYSVLAVFRPVSIAYQRL